MHGRVILAVVAAVAAAAVSTTATASTTRAAAGARIDLSTTAAAASYLRSLGLDPHGFVVQRGAHNYAGPRCPGAGWTCTAARRVLQVSTRSTDDNDFVCSPSTSTGPDSCVIVQTAAGSDNVAVCTERSGARDRTQTCDVTQTNTTGANTVTVRQSLVPHGSGGATQTTTVTQTSATGANAIDLGQTIAQNDNTGTKSVSMTQTASQEFDLTQTSVSGANTAVLAQATGQTQTAKHATSGSQSQTADLKGHVEQHSTGLSTVTVGQNEVQAQLSAGGVAQTQTGPMDCCSTQGTNPDDSFSITQTALHTQDPGGTSSETQSAHFASTGSGTATQTYNGETFTQSGPVVDSTTTCSGTESCDNVQPPPTPTDVFVSVGNGQVNEYTQDGTLVRTLDDGSGSVEVTGLAFDPAGNLYATDYTANTVSKYDPTGTLVGTFGSGYDLHPESIVFDAAGDAYVGESDGSKQIREFASSGAPLNAFTVETGPRGSDWIDLAPDGCTIYYTSEGSTVRRFDACTGQQLADFSDSLPDEEGYAIKLLPDGGALVADTTSVVRLDATGAVVQTYADDESNDWFSLALSPDKGSFWVGNPSTGEVEHVDLATGEVLGSFDTGVESENEAGGIALGPATASPPVIG